MDRSLIFVLAVLCFYGALYIDHNYAIYPLVASLVIFMFPPIKFKRRGKIKLA